MATSTVRLEPSAACHGSGDLGNLYRRKAGLPANRRLVLSRPDTEFWKAVQIKPNVSDVKICGL